MGPCDEPQVWAAGATRPPTDLERYAGIGKGHNRSQCAVRALAARQRTSACSGFMQCSSGLGGCLAATRAKQAHILPPNTLGLVPAPLKPLQPTASGCSATYHPEHVMK